MILFDLPVYNFILNLFTLDPWVIQLMKLITSCGSTLVIVVGIICTFVLTRDKKIFGTFAIGCVGGIVINQLIKIIVRRPRPSTTFLLASENTYSFPSGHTMMSTIFYGLIIYYVATRVKNKKIRQPIIFLLTLLIVLIGVSRIYLGVHYATDVLGAYVFGIIYLVCYIKFLNRVKNKKGNRK